MAIQIGGTTVIDNSRNVTNVLGVGNSATTIYYGDGSQLTNLPAPTISDSFIPEDTKTISINTTLNNGQSNISFAEDLVIGTGVTFTVSAGSTVRMDAFNVINASVLSASVDLDIPNGTTAQRPSAPVAGSIRWNSEYSLLEVYTGTEWKGIALNISFISGDVGVFGGGNGPSNTIDYITIASVGNAIDFGDLSVARSLPAACSSSTRGVFGGGLIGPTNQNVIDYITIAATGNVTDFGDLTIARQGLSACSSSTHGVFGGGATPTNSNVIDYITIATTGNATDFGDLTVARQNLSACSSSTRGVFGGGNSGAPAQQNTLDYITIATTGNATDFGDLTSGRRELASCSSSTRGVFGGGYVQSPVFSYVNIIDYITIASTGNATDFGDLTQARLSLSACSSSTRGVFGGGGAPASQNTIDYIVIATTGNATDFGDLTVARTQLAACSSAHGGLS